MSDIMRPIPFAQLIKWVQGEYKNHGSVFGIKKEKFFYPSSRNVEVFGKKTSVPIGPSAGPHTQLAQNILVSFLAGGRFMELKTVQTMDGEELRKALSRPSINAACEGYNVEWSTELTVQEALEEYIKAWFLCHIFAVEFNICEKADVIFTMSAGYSLDGIKSEKIDLFIEGMKNAQNTEIWRKCYGQIEDCLSSFANFTKDSLVSIPSEISDRIIISTFYNCPSDETEKIASYFINDKKLHTYIKCNPTLLGFETVRGILDEAGYGHISFNDHFFKNDIQFNDALKMLRRLKTASAKTHTGFGVKLTNTLPVEIKQNELPGKIMYLSGRALFPLSICTAKKICEAFHGELPVSYSGGADFFNLKDILETGVCPVTMVTNTLKPGGIARFNQLALLCQEIAPNTRSVNVKALNALCEKAVNMKHYRGDYGRKPQKMPGPPPLFDCKKAPCVDGCPAGINIPQFTAAAEDYNEAIKIIALDNSAPSITGALCDHPCQQKCARLYYDDPLQIKHAHMAAAKTAQEYYNFSIKTAQIRTDESAAVIGAGCAGMAAAVFLRRNGVAVTVYEKRKHPYGAVQYLIPSFKISDDDIFRDYDTAVKTGVEFVFNAPEISIGELKKKHRFIVIATGAWKETDTAIKTRRDIIPGAIGFLEDIKISNYSLNLGKKVAVMGGESAAIYCARAAIRNKGVESVTIIYSGTADTMPVLPQEKEQALAENIVISELLKGVSWEDGILTCEQTALDDCDSSGIRSVKGTERKQELHFDTVISAAGVKADTEQFTASHILLDGNFPVTNGDLESSLFDVYIAGSCRTGILKTVNAVADGKKAAAGILKKLKIIPDFSTGPSFAADEECVNSAYMKKGVIRESKNDNTDLVRCLSCGALCEICADVCPNRANIPVLVREAGKAQDRQILHIDSMCNECGNCAVFCPYDGKPYKEKPALFINEEDFEESENAGFLKTGKNTFKVRLQDKSVAAYRIGGKTIPPEWSALIETVTSKYGYLFPE